MLSRRPTTSNRGFAAEASTVPEAAAPAAVASNTHASGEVDFVANAVDTQSAAPPDISTCSSSSSSFAKHASETADDSASSQAVVGTQRHGGMSSSSSSSKQGLTPSSSAKAAPAPAATRDGVHIRQPGLRPSVSLAETAAAAIALLEAVGSASSVVSGLSDLAGPG